MSNSSKLQSSKKQHVTNPLEIMREQLLKPIESGISNQIFNLEERKHFSGEIYPGESLEMSEVFSGKREQKKQAQEQKVLISKLQKEEKVLIEKRTNELTVEIKAIHSEIQKVAQTMPNLEQQVQIATFQATNNPGIFDLFFLRELFNTVKKFRKNIENASLWLTAANRRASKKNHWGQKYKKHGARYLLSGEHYLSRSAA